MDPDPQPMPRRRSRRPRGHTHGGGIDPLALVARPPEDRTWAPSVPVFAPLIHPSARVEAFATVDAGLRRPTTVEQGAWLFKHVHIGHDARVEAFAEIATGSVVGGHAVVEAHAKVGIGATILPYRRVGHHAVVGAGAVVVKDVPPYATVAGNPARILRDDERDPRPHTERTPLAATAPGAGTLACG